MKVCKKCQINRELTEYHKNKSSKDGYYSVCKVCKRIKNNKYKELNREAERIRNKNWYLDNKRHKHDYYKIYYSLNKHLFHAAYIRRLNHIKKATLSGYKQEIDIIYKDRPKGHHVDHIVPLQGKEVSGLHVPWNLQYLPAKENLSKGNKYLKRL